MILDRLRRALWPAVMRVLGAPPELTEARAQTARLRAELDRERADRSAERDKLDAELQRARDERLSWQGREATCRKALQDSQERAKDLLEQVVRLTHQQREAKKSLLDEKFKTSTTPLERNRFEMELTQARGDARRAEQRAKEAESQMAAFQKENASLRKEAGRTKALETDLSWARQQSTAHLQALSAAVARIRALESRRLKAWVRPAIRKASPNVRAAIQALAN
ncbi:MAG: hypothetical protein JXR96_20370 [Deltaproteobacteria bacterium]|nr:hypothetical protein [Deltaproteobacteria bacterium]